MKKIKKNHKNLQKKSWLNSKSMFLMGISAVILLMLFVIMFIESNDEKLVIKNNSNLKLEYVNTYFVGEEGPLHEGLLFEGIEANEAISYPFKKINLLGTESNLEIRFKFENHDELFVDAGYFNDTFSGKINIAFNPTEDDNVLNLKVKASNSILPSQLIYCNDNFNIILDEGYVD